MPTSSQRPLACAPSTHHQAGQLEALLRARLGWDYRVTQLGGGGGGGGSDGGDDDEDAPVVVELSEEEKRLAGLDI